jgi:ketosteroid isomerase-like protein
MSASAQQNRDIVRRYARMFDTGDLDEADELFAPDFIVRHLDAPELDREGWKGFSRPFVSGFSQRRLTVEDLVSEGDQVVARMRVSGGTPASSSVSLRPAERSASRGWCGFASPRGRSSNTGANSTPWACCGNWES